MRPSKLRLPESTAATASSPVAHALADGVGQRPRVPDAGRAAVADELEAELVEVRREPGSVQVVGHDARAGGEARLDPGLRAEPAPDRVAGEQAGGDHDRRVRGVRARRDRRDHDGAVVQRVAGSPFRATGTSMSREPKTRWKLSATDASATRSCGLLGPARLGSTLARSSSTSVVERRASASPSRRKRPCAFV